MDTLTLRQAAQPLHLPAQDFHLLFQQLGPSLGLWRGAEIAVLRSQEYLRPVLDLGCGDGLITSLVLSQVEYGVDPYRQALDAAARRRLYGRLVDQPVEKADIPAGSVGTVVSNSVFEHLPDPEGIIRTVARLLRPGGKFIFTTPSDAFSAWLAFPFRRYTDWRNRHFDHHNLWSEEKWRDALERVNLDVVEVRPYLTRRWVRAWDLMDLIEQIWIGRRRLVGIAWKRLSPQTLTKLAQRASQIDLSSPPPGGGRLIVAIKR